MNKLFKNAMVWIVIAVVLLTVFQSFTPNSIRQQTLDYTSFIELVKTGNVSEVVFEDNLIKAKRINGDRFITYNPETDNTALIGELSKSGVRISASPPKQPAINSQQVRTIIMIIAFIWLPFALWAAYLASNRDQSKILWFFLTLIFPIAILFIAFKDKVKKN